MKKRIALSAVLAAFLLAILACSGLNPKKTGGVTQAPGKTATLKTANTKTPPGEGEPAEQETPAEAEEPSEGAVGEEVVQGGYKITLVSVEKGKTYYDFLKPEEGNIFIAVELIIESVSDEGVDVNPFYCSLKDSDDNEYYLYILGKDPVLESNEKLAKGEKMEGWVTFEIPEDATGLVFVYEPLFGLAEIRIEIDLGF